MPENNYKFWIEHALKLAEKGKFTCSPNPMVGAVIIDNNKIVGEGFHKKAGEPHAEINAINNAGYISKNAALVVTLEPCSTHGRTPPCTEAIINAGIKKVIVGTVDPNPKHAGNGLDILKSAGVNVILLNDPNCKKLNEKFNKFIEFGFPFVHIKWAMTLDGKIATFSGDSKWISSDKSRFFVHYLRAEYDAVLTGSGTVLKDNPQLNVRLEGEWRQPAKIIIDSLCKTPPESNIFKSSGKVIIACGENAPENNIKQLQKSGAEIIRTPINPNGKINLPTLLKSLAKKNVSSIFVEGGAELTGAFFDAKLVDKITAFIAPKIIGGKNALSPVGGIGIKKINQAFQLKNIELKQFDSDVMLTGYID